MDFLTVLPMFLEGSAAAAFDITSTMTDAVSQVKGDALGVLGLVVPALVTVVGAGVAVRYGVKWLRTFSKS